VDGNVTSIAQPLLHYTEIGRGKTVEARVVKLRLPLPSSYCNSSSEILSCAPVTFRCCASEVELKNRKMRRDTHAEIKLPTQSRFEVAIIVLGNQDPVFLSTSGSVKRSKPA
jgi:hypothetical protein